MYYLFIFVWNQRHKFINNYLFLPVTSILHKPILTYSDFLNRVYSDLTGHL